MNQHELGLYGEQLARDFLVREGYTIRCSNYRKLHLELDLICEKDNYLVVVEVKTRASDALGEPWRAVTRAKQKQIIRAANFYITEFDIHLETRFDVISIIHNPQGTQLEHITDAFTP